MKKAKEKKYAFWSNFKFLTSWIHHYHGAGEACRKVFILLLQLFLTVYASVRFKFLLDTLSMDAPLAKIWMIVIAIIAIPVFLKLLHKLTDTFQVPAHKYCTYVYPYLYDTICDADYECMENSKQKALMDQYVNYGTQLPNYWGFFCKVPFQIAEALIFGTLVTVLHPLVLLLLILSAVLQYVFRVPLNRFQEKMQPHVTENNRKFDYATNLARDYDYAKEVRLYNMSAWLDTRRIDCMTEHRKIHDAIQNRVILSGLGVHILNFLRDGLAYFILIREFAVDEITAGTFVMLFAAITSLSNTINGFSALLSDVQKYNLKITEFRKIEEDLPTRHNHGKGIPIPTDAPAIEFRHVSYRYPNAEEDTVKDVSFRIEKGQKIALVGVNGAGKTTLVKLLCGLYLPTEGEILMDGIPMREYNIDNYYSIFSAVFQEIFLLPYSIAEHIAVTMDKEKIDRARVTDAIRQAGLEKKIASLPDGIDSLLDKEANDNAVDLSGGEKQKLSLARAIYLGRPVLILDEPTSALDPIAENEMYRRFDSTVQNKTALFISHRLASTRFCDCIFHMEDGKIIETGTHRELMAKGGKYRNMYDVQSNYYQEKGGKTDDPR